MFPSINIQLDLLLQGAAEIVPAEELERKIAASLKAGKPLIVKQGFDPSAPDLHLGHTVSIRKLKQFQDLGHTVIFVIGDFTGLVGDPSGRNVMRPRMSKADIECNAATYKEQVFKILDPVKTVVKFNSEWLGKLDIYQLLDLTAHYTVARMLERDDFEKRYRGCKPIALLEFLYPLFQAYDSVATKCDIELGGTDQKFNLLLGRHIQTEYGLDGQIAFLMPLLIGTDGVVKMSKSLGNFIALNDPPEEIYGKTMSIPDELIYSYFELATDINQDELSGIKAQLADTNVNPRDLKRKLARELVRMYYSAEEAEEAERGFDCLFVDKQQPHEMDEKCFPKSEIMICKLLYELGLTSSVAEGKRMINQGAVKIDGVKIDDCFQIISVDNPKVIQVGKRKFTRVIPK